MRPSVFFPIACLSRLSPVLRDATNDVVLNTCCARPVRTLKKGTPENEDLYTDVDRFHMQKDKIKFGGGAGDSSDSDDSVRFVSRCCCC